MPHVTRPFRVSLEMIEEGSGLVWLACIYAPRFCGVQSIDPCGADALALAIDFYREARDVLRASRERFC